MSEKFDLKWKDFHSNTSRSFELFRNATYLHDVTLVSDDLKHIPAHKLALAACSQFFQNIFQRTKHSQPLICLDGINSVDLQHVLDYVYKGKVMINQEDLGRFFSVANKLKLEGLRFSDKAEESSGDTQTTNTEPELSYIQNFMAEKPIKETHNASFLEQESTAVAVLGEEGMSMEDHKQMINDKVTRNSDGSVSCNVCAKQFCGSKANSMFMAKRHVEVHLDGVHYPCPSCGKAYRTKSSLSYHLYGRGQGQGCLNIVI